jgi:hypothetical protein
MREKETANVGIRRHAGSSIDFDFYRAKATACRRQALRDAAAVKSVCAVMLTMFGALVLAVVIAGKPLHAPDTGVAAASCAGPVAAVAQPRKKFCALDQAAEWQGSQQSRLELGETP